MSTQLKMISAGAGAGKTTRLSAEIIDVLTDVQPEKVVATTFTKKAAEELIERIRFELLKRGETEKAARILDGYVGTMNSVFGRLIEEFALYLGLSPMQNLLEENEALMMFNAIAHQSITQYEKQHFKTLARFNLLHGDYPWSTAVLNVLKLARENGIQAEQVKPCAQYSIEQARKWYEIQDGDVEEETNKLITTLKNAIKVIPAADKTKNTQTAVETSKNIINFYERYQYLTWDHWAKASKLNPGAKSKEEFAPAIQIASRSPYFQALYDDFETVIETVFNCASDAMELYEQEKKIRGLIDFTDQEYLALKLLNEDHFVELLKERIEAVFVDEFQDSSPLQIALNMKLREIAKSTTWVGDLKQAIYGFRGTDPDLMKTAMDEIPNVEWSILNTSYRSRKSLVQFTNELFKPVFETVGLTADLVELEPKREDLPEQNSSVELWKFQDKCKKEEELKLIAIGIAEVLEQKEAYQVAIKGSQKTRALKPSDIAVLCRGNDDCKELANALNAQGIEVMLGGEGLLQTTEVIYAISTLRYLINSQDTLALAQIIHLSSEQWQNGQWLQEWLSNDAFEQELKSNHLIIQALSNQKQHISHMSPCEMLDFALVKAQVDIQVLRWGNGQQRLANLDRLRKLAEQYEHSVRLNGYAATAGGLLLFLEQAKQDKDLNQRAESMNENAVNVLTYHRAKGLEWPFVILYSLNKETISSRKIPEVFGRVLAVSTTGFNVNQPLEGRMLYYWPWPFAKNTTKVGFDQLVQQSHQLIERERQLKEETQRLLYVGITRARDYLVFATKDFNKATWLKEQQNSDGEEVINVIALDGEQAQLMVNGAIYTASYKALSLEEENQTFDTTAAPTYIGTNLDVNQFEGAYFKPSSAKFEETEATSILKHTTLVLPIEEIGSRTAIVGNPDMTELGQMVHTFLAVDALQSPEEKRLQLAKRIQGDYIIHAITAESMLEMSANLQSFLSNRYSNVVALYREYPIHVKLNGRKAAGIVDLLVELEDGWILIDHKTFPGTPDKWAEKAQHYLPQLQVYAHAIELASNKPVKEAWIHMPIVGQMVHFSNEHLKISDEKVLVF